MIMPWTPPSESDLLIERRVGRAERVGACGRRLRGSRWGVVVLLGVSIWGGGACASAEAAESWTSELQAVFDQLVEEGALVGAQVVAGQAERIELEHHVGWRSHRKVELVDANTRFGIGSDSKPMASAVVMKLVGEGRLQLDDPVARWLPDFDLLQMKDGEPAERSPTVREVMTHRAGFYSQKTKITREQSRLIRDFSQSLAEAVAGIAQEPLSAQPGQDYAYSGAGYCVLGRVAEVAGERTMEELLQSRLCAPLGLNRTTFFPKDDENVAVGARRVNGRWVTDPQAPHLTKPENRLALVGGSIYSTASDQARFAQMVWARGRSDGRSFFTRQEWSKWVERQSPQASYGLGWGQAFGAGGKGKIPTRLAHNGALGSYRASIVVNLETGFFCVANWTLSGAVKEDELKARIRKVVKRAEFNAKAVRGEGR